MQRETPKATTNALVRFTVGCVCGAALAGLGVSRARHTTSGGAPATEAGRAPAGAVVAIAETASRPSAAALLEEFRLAGIDVKATNGVHRFEVLTKLRERLLSLTEAERKTLALDYRFLPEGERSRMVGEILQELVSQLPAQALLERLAASGATISYSWDIRVALLDWAKTDFRAARAWVDSHLREAARASGYASLAAVAGARNFGEGAELLKEVCSGDEYSKALRQLAREVDCATPGVDAVLAGLPSIQERIELGTDLARHTATSSKPPNVADLKRALSWINSWPEAVRLEMVKTTPGGAVQDPTFYVVSEYAEADPDGAWQVALAMTGPAGNRARSAVLSSLQEKDSVRAIELVDGISSPDEQASLLMSVMLSGRWAGDAAAMSRLFDAAIARPEGAGRYVSYLVRSWAEQAPAQAARAIGQLPMGSTYETAVSAVAESWSGRDPAAALAWSQTLPEGSARLKALGSVLRRLASRDPDAAVAAALALTVERERREALPAAAAGWAEKAPVAAAGFALGQNDPEIREVALGKVVQTWAERTPEEAGAWVLSLEDGYARRTALCALAYGWKDTAAARRFLENFPGGSIRDAGLIALTRRDFSENPEQALRWLTRQSRSEVVGGEVKGLAETWLSHDPAQARAWIRASSELTPEAKAALLDTPPRK